MKHHIQLGFHTCFKVKIRLVTSSDILFPSLALFWFVMLYYFFVMFVLTCWHVYSAFWSFFFQMIKITKMGLIRIIEILLLIKNNNPNCHRTHHAPSDSSIPFLSSLSPLHLSPPFLHSLHWLDCASLGVRLSTGEYTSGCNLQKTTCILARRVRKWDHPRRLTSYNANYHLLPCCHPSLLSCRYFMINCYWYLLFI